MKIVTTDCYKSKDLMDDSEPSAKRLKLNGASAYEESLSPTLELTDSFGEIEGESAPTLKASDSITRDVKAVKALLCSANSEKVTVALLGQRDHPERVAVVTNHFLDLPPDSDNEQGASSSSPPVLVRDLFSDVERVTKIVHKSIESIDLNPSEIYHLLEEHEDSVERVALVAGILIGREKSSTAMSSQVSSTVLGADPVFNDLRQIVKLFPDKDRSEVFKRLDELKDTPNRVQAICTEFLCQQEAEEIKKSEQAPKAPPTSLKVKLSTEDSGTIPEEFKNDPLYRDMIDIVQVFPHWERTEVYAHLEAHFYDKNRKQTVIDELLPVFQASREGDNAPTPDGSVVAPASPAQSTSGLSLIEQVQYLKAIFPDCEPNFLFDKLEALPNDEERVHKVAEELMESKKYPKMSELQEIKKKQELKQRIQNLTFDLPEFLKTFPDPIEHFKEGKFSITHRYKEHARAQLLNYFPRMTEAYVDKILLENKGHFTPALVELQRISESGKRKNRGIFLHKARKTQVPMPDEPDETFFKELMYTQNEFLIREHLEEAAERRKQRIETLRVDGALGTCGCCFDDEVLPEELHGCGREQHLFCELCVRRSTETNVGDGKADFPCLAEGCDAPFPLELLQLVLLPNVFSQVLRKIQEKEISAAGIDGLVSCPFCPYATIIDNDYDKILHCRNPDCMKESCRQCGEAAHIPLRCDEVEKGKETNMRTYIEEKIAEAMIRTCYQCKKRFLKDFGCNKMTCTCGASMCYVCQKPIKNYDHFGDGKDQCPIEIDVFEMHRKEMEKAGVTAKDMYLQEHPEAAGISLQHDPLQEIQQAKKERDAMRLRLPAMPPGMPPFMAGMHPGIPGLPLRGFIGFRQDVDSSDEDDDDDDF